MSGVFGTRFAKIWHSALWLLGSAAFFSSTIFGFSVSLSAGSDIKDQGDYPYCTLYAMASFLEIWRNETQNISSDRLPALDPAFLAVAYNAEASTGISGTTAHWLTTIVAKWGVLPVGAKPQDPTVEWPMKEWREKHATRMPEAATKKILSALFTHPSVAGPFTAKDYLEKVIKIRFSDLTLRRLPLDYYFFAGGNSDKEEARYRYGSRNETEKHILEIARAQGIEPVQETDDLRLYDTLVTQLYKHRPVLVGINAGLTAGPFRSYKKISHGALMLDPDAVAMHSMVAVAHCDRNNRSQTLCPDNDEEGVVLQNSGGNGANNSGYVFVEKSALLEILDHALVDRY